MLEMDEILSLIPHRPPFLWIDRVEELVAGERCVSQKTVDSSESFFSGHFPKNAILPGVFLIEAVAQTAAVMMAVSRKSSSESRSADPRTNPLLARVNYFKFSKPVNPGSLLIIETTKIAEVQSATCVSGTVRVQGESVAEGELWLLAGEGPAPRSLKDS